MNGIDYTPISNLLVARGKVLAKPVAISLFKDSVPPGNEPIDDTPLCLSAEAETDAPPPALIVDNFEIIADGHVM